MDLYYILLRCLGTVNSTAHTMSFTKEAFRRLWLFVVAFDLEKMAHADFSGMNLGGSLVTISGRNIRRAGHEDTSTAKKAYITV